jgi:hypothetical protein
MVAGAVAAIVAAFGAGTASAAFPGQNGEIVFVRFDGADYELLAMDASGQNQVPLTDNATDDIEPDWQPLNAPAFDLSGPAKQRSARFVSVL